MKETRIPLWKKWLSHIIEFELEKLDSEHGHELSLCLSDGRFQLNTDKAIYSWEDKYDNFYKAFQQLNWDLIPGKEFLSMGFGLGSIVQMLERNFKKSFYYTGVELDENVIYLAEKYILHQLKSSVQIIQAPAEVFIQITEEKFDIITIDLFINDRIPPAIRTHDFLTCCQDSLNENGLILMNHLANTDTDIEIAKRFYSKVFSKVFPRAMLLDVDGNYIFFSESKYLR